MDGACCCGEFESYIVDPLEADGFALLLFVRRCIKSTTRRKCGILSCPSYAKRVVRKGTRYPLSYA
jgi:hypothetical protein